jgi:hypothetical protein
MLASVHKIYMLVTMVYINITILVLDIIHRPDFYRKHDVLETGLLFPSSGRFHMSTQTEFNL